MPYNFNSGNNSVVTRSLLRGGKNNEKIIDQLNERFITSHNDEYQVVDMLQARNDSWQNVMSGMGIAGRDRKESTSFSSEMRLAETICRNLYTYSGLSKAIADLPVYDGLRQWFTVSGDTENLIQNKMKKLGAKYELSRAWRWARCYGGALVVMGINDGRELTDPVDQKNIKNIEFLKVYHRYRTSRQTYYLDPTQGNYWETETYFVNPPRGTGYQVHESRCLIFDGIDVAPEIRVGNVMWGDSVFQAVYSRLRGLGEAYNNIEHIIGEFLLMVTKIKGLSSKIAEGKVDEIIRRAITVNQTRHLQNSYMIDADGEDAQRISATVSGLGELMEKLMMAVSAECRIPIRRLFGTPIGGAGLSNNGDAETRDYYDFVTAEREVTLLPPLEKLIKYIMISSEGDFGGKEIDNWQIVFPPMWEEPMSVQLDNKLKQANVDKLYNEIIGDEGPVLTRDEIRESRFQGKYSHDTVLDEDRHETSKKGIEDLGHKSKGE